MTQRVPALHHAVKSSVAPCEDQLLAEAERRTNEGAGIKRLANRRGHSTSLVTKQTRRKSDLLPGEPFETEKRSPAQLVAMAVELALMNGSEHAFDVLDQLEARFGRTADTVESREAEIAAAVNEFAEHLASKSREEIKDYRDYMARSQASIEFPGPVPVTNPATATA